MSEIREACSETAKIHKNGKDIQISCCLFAPHQGHKHLSPTLLITLGGTHIPLEGWSPWIDDVQVERCPDCGKDLTVEEHSNYCEPDLWSADGEAIL